MCYRVPNKHIDCWMMNERNGWKIMEKSNEQIGRKKHGLVGRKVL